MPEFQERDASLARQGPWPPLARLVPIWAWPTLADLRPKVALAASTRPGEACLLSAVVVPYTLESIKDHFSALAGCNLKYFAVGSRRIRSYAPDYHLSLPLGSALQSQRRAEPEDG